MSNVLCQIDHVSVTYHGDVDVRAVQDVSLTIGEGEIVGLAGESGCGKSTLAMALAQLLPDNAFVSDGRILFKGQDILRLSGEELRQFRWDQVSLVSQSAMNSLNPVLTVGEQIEDAIWSHQGKRSVETRQRARELLRLVEVDPDRVSSYPHQLSGGMRQRAMIAMALALDPKLIIMDEPTTALDVVVQEQIIQQIKDLQRKLGFSVLFITHDMSLLLSIADRIAIMYAGQLVEQGSSDDLLVSPAHPYTQGLIDAFPSVFESRELVGIGGSPPSMAHPPSGCRFHERCPKRLSKCDSQEPGMIGVGAAHHAKCHLLEKGAVPSES
ncbi:ABC transporter ATP-binding protein [Sulfobacillus harzensis]|uniref:ABC transporter ATP-binding protein n=1 Tax=Sulfobacillus harzensis TaxID=2729629 RepID=A0A7Y0L3I0_9FIRM|nr:ABC transporter ATP-binding protein [Sulfobacillus harzensis]NMP22267.1 ABC transporter ATP-binding protein [Sulfobacillus harzensis]